MAVNSVEYKGSTRKCLACGDVKIWDYPNMRNCPTGKNHRWRTIKETDLTKEENKSIDEQINYDLENVKHKPIKEFDTSDPDRWRNN